MKNTPSITMSLSGQQHLTLREILFPGDGNEHVAIVLCGRRLGAERERLTIRKIHRLPDEAYKQSSPVRVSWETATLPPLLEEAQEKGLSVFKIHSHPTGISSFSKTDDGADDVFLDNMRNWTESSVPHGSAVMLPDGRMFGRVLDRDGVIRPLSCISVAGSDLHFWYSSDSVSLQSEICASHTLAFGSRTTELLRRLRIGVVGCSGTGCLVIEQLARLGVGELVLVDDDAVEDRNLNRIIHATADDAEESRFKVDVVAQAIRREGLGTEVVALPLNLRRLEAVKAIAGCDVIFGCMDSMLGRLILNSIAVYYTIPYFDLGVRLDTRDDGANGLAISEVAGSVHYLQPGGSSLLNRGVIDAAQASAEALRQDDPLGYAQEVKEKYIIGANEQRPAVISVNMTVASLAVNDFLARIRPYRQIENEAVGCIRLSLASLDLFPEAEGLPCPVLAKQAGVGDVEPMLGLPMLSMVPSA